jgi:hypothetical protein
MNQLDRHGSGLDDVLATYLVADIDPAARRLSIANAGHSPPLLVDHYGYSTFAPAPTAGPPGLGRSSASIPRSSITLTRVDRRALHRRPRRTPLAGARRRSRSDPLGAAGTHAIPVERLAHRLLTASLAAFPADDDATVLIARLDQDGGVNRHAAGGESDTGAQASIAADRAQLMLTRR